MCGILENMPDLTLLTFDVCGMFTSAQFLEIQEEYIKDEQKNLKKELIHAQEEVTM